MATALTYKRATSIVILCWLSMIGFDFLLHGGVLASFYVESSPFLLPPEKSFRLIPLGYLSFLVLAILLVWLMRRLDVRGGRAGFIFGLKVGALVWGSLVFGLVSISTASTGLLVGWFFGQTIGLAIAGTLAAIALGGGRLVRLFVIVGVFIVFSFIMTVLLQSLGLVPTIRI